MPPPPPACLLPACRTPSHRPHQSRPRARPRTNLAAGYPARRWSAPLPRHAKIAVDLRCPRAAPCLRSTPIRHVGWSAPLPSFPAVPAPTMMVRAPPPPRRDRRRSEMPACSPLPEIDADSAGRGDLHPHPTPEIVVVVPTPYSNPTLPASKKVAWCLMRWTGGLSAPSRSTPAINACEGANASCGGCTRGVLRYATRQR
jgi:hypothetical protein